MSHLQDVLTKIVQINSFLICSDASFEQQLCAICQSCVRTTAPQHIVCERVERLLPEMFVFVAVPGVLAQHNLAERNVCPLVVARKISGHTLRSPTGSAARMDLASLFGTWVAGHLNLFHQCLALLTSSASLG